MSWSPRDLLPLALGGARLLPPDLLLRGRPALAAGLRRLPPVRETIEERVTAAFGAEVDSRCRGGGLLRPPGGLGGAFARHPPERLPGFARGALFRDRRCGRPHHGCALAGPRRGAGRATPPLPRSRWPRRSISRADHFHHPARHPPRPGAGQAGLVPRARGGGRYRPQSRGGTTAAMREMAAAVGALRRNRVLALTPDLLQQPGRGVPVTLWGRTAWLPAGAAVLAGRTGAVLLPSGHRAGRGRLPAGRGAPLPVGDVRRDEGEVARVMQAWADSFDRFLHRHPEMWLFGSTGGGAPGLQTPWRRLSSLRIPPRRPPRDPAALHARCPGGGRPHPECRAARPRPAGVPGDRRRPPGGQGRAGGPQGPAPRHPHRLPRPLPAGGRRRPGGVLRAMLQPAGMARFGQGWLGALALSAPALLLWIRWRWLEYGLACPRAKSPRRVAQRLVGCVAVVALEEPFFRGILLEQRCSPRSASPPRSPRAPPSSPPPISSAATGSAGPSGASSSSASCSPWPT